MSDELLREIIQLQREMLTELRLLREGLFPQGAAQAAAAVEDVSPQAAQAAPAARGDEPPVAEGPAGDDVLAELLTDAEHALLLDAEHEPEPAQARSEPSASTEPAERRASGLRFPGFGGFTDDDEDEPAPARKAPVAADPAPERQPARANGHHAQSEDVDELRGLFDTGKSASKARQPARQPAMDDLSGSFGEAGERGRGGARVTTSDLAGELGDLLSGLKRRNRERSKTFEEFQGRFGKR